jgi:ribosomal protein L37AE/L43A
MGFGIREGRRQAKDNLSGNEEGDCARCGGNAAPSSLPEYLQCVKCGFEWKDPSSTSSSLGPKDSISRDIEKLEEFKREMSAGEGLAQVLGVDDDLNSEQKDSLGRLQNKWLSGMHGQYNAAEEERKPLMIAFDDDDNLLETQVGAIHLTDNIFDGGEEIRVEYPGMGTEFFVINDDDALGWKRGRSLEETARNIASIINRSSKLVHASAGGTSVNIELRDATLDSDSLVIFVDDPGGKNMSVERLGVILDPDQVQVYEDYHRVIKIALADGIITPSEDQMLWAMRQNLDISDEDHVRIVIDLFGDNAVKECPDCGINSPLYTEYSAWWCDGCQQWV